MASITIEMTTFFVVVVHTQSKCFRGQAQPKTVVMTSTVAYRVQFIATHMKKFFITGCAILISRNGVFKRKKKKCVWCEILAKM